MTASPSPPTPKPVVTIYGTYGAGAKQVGHAVAHHLGLPFFGPAFSSEAIEGAPDDVREQEAAFLRKMVAVMAATFGAGNGPDDDAVERHRQELIEENRRQVQGCAHLGGVMIGRHGALLLADRPNTVHVLLTGSRRGPDRAGGHRIGYHAGARLPARSPRGPCARRHGIALYDWDPGIPEHYDLVVNTSRIPLDGVVDAILAALRAVTD